MDDLQARTREKMDGAIARLKRELAKIRTGRASTSLLDDIIVDYYGTPTPIAQVATVSVPEARMLTITPWEQPLVPAIERALMTSDLGLTPANDGKMIRLPIPPLTEERRKDFVKHAHKVGEDARISVRNARRESVDQVKRAQKAGDMAEDDGKRLQDQVQKITDGFIAQIDKILTRKDQEILEI